MQGSQVTKRMREEGGGNWEEAERSVRKQTISQCNVA